jgi:UDP-N-acetylmuramoyl-L-alanyl-D-glutamate--2,6-diaminopimelate ligase
MKETLRAVLPSFVLRLYHRGLAELGALIYGAPSRKLVVIGVTGTKGKSSVVELIAEILRAGGKTTAAASTIRFSIADEHEPNLFKMTMPGRLFLQKFLRRALTARCTHAVIEMTSEGVLQERHRAVDLNALVFTNLSPEHIERHGSMQAYAAAKLALARHLERSPKRPRIIVANLDDKYGQQFLDAAVEVKAPFSVRDAEPYSTDEKNIRFVWREMLFTVPLPGAFSLKNCLAALTLGEALGIPLKDMHRALERISPIAGRAERVEVGQPFPVIIDYAHTPDSLRAVFETYAKHRIIAVFGATGGGRDQWKRAEMGKVADEFATRAILTDDDSYEEDPRAIAREIAKGFSRITPTIEPDRRKAIAQALAEAKEGDAVLLLGKGTDPYLMGKYGSRMPWSEVGVAREELKRLGYN